MGLAPYGEPKYAPLILDHLIDLKPDGTFRLDQSYFNYCTGLTMTNERFDRLFGGPPRKPEEHLTQRHMDLAASIQAVTEEIVLRLTRSLARRPGRRISASRAASRSIASPTARFCATADSSTSGFSPPRATPAARSARRLRPITSHRVSRGTSTTGWTR